MPVYEYQCQKCGKLHEVTQKFSDPLLTTCPVCKGKLKKLISNTSFVLKGTGWYVTDYARKDNGGNGHRKKSEKAPEEKTDSGKAEAAETKPESKPEAKKDKKPEKKASSA